MIRIEVDIKELNETKVKELVEDAYNKGENVYLTLENKAEPFDCITIDKDSTKEEIKGKLNKWLELKDDTEIELDQWDKEDYLLELFKEYVYETDSESLKELELDTQEGYYSDYYDESLGEVLSYAINIFDECETKHELKLKMNEFLGHYSGNELFSHEGLNYLYIQLYEININ